MAVQTSPELWFHTSSLEPHGIAWHGMAWHSSPWLRGRCPVPQHGLGPDDSRRGLYGPAVFDDHKKS